MNKVILMGRLTRDPEVRYSQGDNATAIAKFALAVNRKTRERMKRPQIILTAYHLEDQQSLQRSTSEKAQRL